MDSDKHTLENKKPPRDRRLKPQPEISDEQREAYENIPKMTHKKAKKLARKILKA